MKSPADETPQERVDYYVGRQAAQLREIGASVNVEEIRRGTAALLGLADIESNRGAPTKSVRPGKEADDVLAAKRRTSGEGLAAASGTEFYYKDERVEKLIEKPAPSAQVPRGFEGEKHFALLRRITLLMKRIPGYRLKPGESLYAGCIFPRFAQLLDMNTRHAALTDPKSHGLGKYAELKIEDRQRRYYRELERICDLSNTAVGTGWWFAK